MFLTNLRWFVVRMTSQHAKCCEKSVVPLLWWVHTVAVLHLWQWPKHKSACLWRRAEVSFPWRLLAALLPRTSHLEAPELGFLLFSNSSISFFSKRKDPNLFNLSTFLQMAVNLSDGTENFLGEYWYPAVSDFEQIYRNSYSYGKRRLLDRKQSCATSCTQKTGDGQVLQIQLDCELIGEA